MALYQSSHGVDKDQKTMWKLAGRFSAVGLELGIAVFLGWLLGNYLDKAWKTQPYLTIVFVILGAIAGFRGLYRVVRNTDMEKL